MRGPWHVRAHSPHAVGSARLGKIAARTKGRSVCQVAVFCVRAGLSFYVPRGLRPTPRRRLPTGRHGRQRMTHARHTVLAAARGRAHHASLPWWHRGRVVLGTHSLLFTRRCVALKSSNIILQCGNLNEPPQGAPSAKHHPHRYLYASCPGCLTGTNTLAHTTLVIPKRPRARPATQARTRSLVRVRVTVWRRGTATWLT